MKPSPSSCECHSVVGDVPGQARNTRCGPPSGYRAKEGFIMNERSGRAGNSVGRMAILFVIVTGAALLVTSSPEKSMSEPFLDCGGFSSTTRCVDVSPTIETFSPNIGENSQRSISGKILSLAASDDGQRLYAGAYSGVWRSDDKGETWTQLTRPQPPVGTHEVPGALMVPNIFDLAVSPANKDEVLAATSGDTRVPSQLRNGNGIYRSSDGGNSWDLAHRFVCPASPHGGPVGQIAFAPDDSRLVYAAGGCAIAISVDGGQR